MIRNEEAERLSKEKEAWAKEDNLSEEEERASWKKIIKICKDFCPHNKDFKMRTFNPSPVWECEESYADEDKTACKKEVVRILKLCGKEDLLINKPA